MKWISFGGLATLLTIFSHVQGTTFEPPGLRNLARQLGVGYGQGYHSRPVPTHLRPHYHTVQYYQRWPVVPPPVYPAYGYPSPAPLQLPMTTAIQAPWQENETPTSPPARRSGKGPRATQSQDQLPPPDGIFQGPPVRSQERSHQRPTAPKPPEESPEDSLDISSQLESGVLSQELDELFNELEQGTSGRTDSSPQLILPEIENHLTTQPGLGSASPSIDDGAAAVPDQPWRLDDTPQSSDASASAATVSPESVTARSPEIENGAPGDDNPWNSSDTPERSMDAERESLFAGEPSDPAPPETSTTPPWLSVESVEENTPTTLPEIEYGLPEIALPPADDRSRTEDASDDHDLAPQTAEPIAPLTGSLDQVLALPPQPKVSTPNNAQTSRPTRANATVGTVPPLPGHASPLHRQAPALPRRPPLRRPYGNAEHVWW